MIEPDSPSPPDRPRRVGVAARHAAGYVTVTFVVVILVMVAFDPPAAVVAAAGAGIGGAVVAAMSAARRIDRPLRRMAAATGTSEPFPGAGALADRLVAETARRERSLQAEADGLQTRDEILSTLTEGVVLIDPADSVQYSNHAARSLLGGVGDRLARLTPMALQRIVAEVRRRGVPAEDEFEYGSSARWMQVAASPVGGGVLLVLRDATEERRIQAMRRDFVADASHELKTPLAAIRAGIEAVLNSIGSEPEKARRFAQQVNQDASRLTRIVSDLLDLSRLEAKHPQFARFRLDTAVSEQVEAAGQRAPGVHFELAAQPVWIDGVEAHVGLAVLNLLNNAGTYSDSGSRVQVWVGRHGGDAVVEVKDEGVGIPSRGLPRIFERFYRVDPGRSRRRGGTGLGLAIVKHVAEVHEGTVEVESELGVGSTFRLRLPAR